MATVTRFSPFERIEQMQRELDRAFAGVFDDRGAAGWLPPVDVEQTDAAVVLKLDLPGVARDAVTVEARDGSLTIKGERTDQREETHEGYVVRERMVGSFARSFTLPPRAKTDEITAEMKDGVLTVVIPRPVEESPKQISVA